MPKYTKGPPPSQQRLPTAPSAVQFRVTLGDMPLQDAYEVVATTISPAETLGTLLGLLFTLHLSTCMDERIISDQRVDLDSMAMHAELSKMFYDAQAARCSLRFFVNHGPEIDATDPVVPHFQQVGADVDSWQFDLVVEQRFTPFEYAISRGDWSSEPDLVHWLEDSTALLLADAGSPNISEATARRLVAQGLFEPQTPNGPRVVTDAGSARRHELESEAESYDQQYGIFEDVLYDDEAQVADFGTGLGQDLRPLVYEAESLDPERTTFLVGMLGSADDALDTQDSQRFFTALLTPAVDRPYLDNADVEQIIETGLALVELDAEARQRDIARRQAVSHARRQTRPKGGQART
ncbi:MAG: hypothetical protein OTJ97_02275 [SAR202 cluster bacterium]|nr:hypothetical protein [SAR202 cluster bacterium]